MQRRPIALGVSLAVHVVAGLLILAAAARTQADGSPRVVQLNGTPRERGAGHDLLFDILRAEGVSIRLVSARGDDAVGLAWWSPTVGLWLAADLLPAQASGRALEVTLEAGEDTPGHIGPVRIDDEGSGRIVVAWRRSSPDRGTPITLTVSEPRSLWDWRRPSTILAGTAPMR